MARDLVQEYGALSALRLMNDLGTDLYVEEKDLMGALQWLDTCIQFGLALSLGLKDTPRKEVLNEAKAAAYHMATYCWPGWGDPAIKVSESEKKLGLQMAKLNMTLCHELRKPDIVAARALAPRSDDHGVRRLSGGDQPLQAGCRARRSGRRNR